MTRTRATRRANTQAKTAKRIKTVKADIICSGKVSKGGEACSCTRCETEKGYPWNWMPTIADLRAAEWSRISLSDSE